jgi:hypothetical protein
MLYEIIELVDIVIDIPRTLEVSIGLEAEDGVCSFVREAKRIHEHL